MAGIFHDASIGNAIHVILVRLILLQGEEVTKEVLSRNLDVIFAFGRHILKLEQEASMHIYEAFLIKEAKKSGRVKTQTSFVHCGLAGTEFTPKLMKKSSMSSGYCSVTDNADNEHIFWRAQDNLKLFSNDRM